MFTPRCSTRLLALLGLYLALLGRAVAGEVSVKAALTHRSTEVGESVQLQIQIDGATGQSRPPAVSVDGFDVHYRGPSTSEQTTYSNGQLTSQITTTHVYTLTATREGDFIIPALNVDVNGKTYKTQPMALKVEKAGGGNARGGGDDKIAIAEINIPKHTAYVGEVLPAELNFYVDAEIRWNIEQMPDLAGEGYTKQKMPEPQVQLAHRDGREWKVVAFRTAITPSKAGRIAVGPAEIPFVAQVPQKRGPRGPRDPFESFFNDPFFSGMGAQQRQYKAEAVAVELDVKPLPVEGRPQDYSGAVGQFKFTVEGSPNRVKIGDPVTMKMKVTGTGNFDRIQAPALVDPIGWHTYPAADDFQASDDLKTTGTKTFEMPVVPETTHKQMPQFRFAFFDPEQGKYVTQTSPPMPLIVEGAPPPAPASAPAATAGEPPTTPKTAAATPAPSDILGLRYERGPRATFTPLYTQRGFLFAQLVPLGVVAVLLGARFLRKDSRTVRLNNLRRERERLWQKLRAESEASEFFDLAARVVQLDTALVTDLEPGSIDAATARRSRPLDADTSAGLDEIFSARAELLYAGSGGPARTSLAPADRQRVLTTLQRFAKSHA